MTVMDRISSSSSSESIDDDAMGASSKCCHFPPSVYPIYIANILYFIPIAINGVAFQAILYNKLCYIKFQNVSLCMNTTFTANHPSIQEEAVAWDNYNMLAQIPIAVVVSLILASYCDKVGHKLPYILPILGNLLATIYLALLATPQFLDWGIGSIFGYSVLCTCLGGSTTVIMSSFSYVALITTKERMPIAMSICEATLLIGTVIGTLINGPIIDGTGLATLMYITAGITLVPLVIVAIFVTDVTSSHESIDKYTWKDVLGISRILDVFKCLFRRRNGSTRLILHLSFAAYTCIYFATNGSSSTNFFYFVKERGMGMTQYSLYNGFLSGGMSIIGPAIIIIGRKYLNIERNIILLISLSSGAIGYAFMSIPTIPYSAWIGGVFICAQTAFYGVMKAVQTSLVEPSELGRLFAYDGIIQLVVGTTASISVKALYSATLGIWPGMYLALCSLLYICAMIFTSVMDIIQSLDGSRNIDVNE